MILARGQTHFLFFGIPKSKTNCFIWNSIAASKFNFDRSIHEKNKLNIQRTKIFRNKLIKSLLSDIGRAKNGVFAFCRSCFGCVSLRFRKGCQAILISEYDDLKIYYAHILSFDNATHFSSKHYVFRANNWSMEFKILE